MEKKLKKSSLFGCRSPLPDLPNSEPFCLSSPPSAVLRVLVAHPAAGLGTMSLRPDSRADRRKKGFKKGIDAEDARRKREDNIIELRKTKRDENLQKKRMVGGFGGDGLSMEDSTRSGAALQQKVCKRARCWSAAARGRCMVVVAVQDFVAHDFPSDGRARSWRACRAW